MRQRTPRAAAVTPGAGPNAGEVPAPSRRRGVARPGPLQGCFDSNHSRLQAIVDDFGRACSPTPEVAMSIDPEPTSATSSSARLGTAERRVLDYLLSRRGVVRDVNRELEEHRTLGERVADRIARFGGSWTFILLFLTVLIGWIVLNTFVLARRGHPFDPYPYILLNLFLSMIAALQAPVIMMSQIRQAARDRTEAAHDYEVNLMAEVEIRTLHDKLDQLRDHDWAALVAQQREQIQLLERLLAHRDAGGSAG